MYVFSALAGFSIGLFTLVLAFILFTLAAGHWLNRISSWKDTLLFAAVGAAAWYIVFISIKFWIFFPLLFLLDRLFG